jgi:hypothetical protein
MGDRYSQPPQTLSTAQARRIASTALFAALTIGSSLVARANSVRDDGSGFGLAQATPAAVSSQPLECQNPAESPPGTSIEFRCKADRKARISRVSVYYRRPGREEFSQLPAKGGKDGWYVATVPASEVVGSLLHYYIEARDAKDREVATIGRVDSPNLVIIRNPASAEDERSGWTGAEVKAEENPLETMRRDREQAAPRSERQRKPLSFWVGLGVGSGYGWHPERRLEFRQDLKVRDGVHASGLMHFSPEIGFQITQGLAIAVQGRHQYIPGAGSAEGNMGAPAGGANAGLLRLLYQLGRGNFQVVFSAMAGAGEGFRLVVPAQKVSGTEMGLDRRDTVRGGPFVFGPGLGLLYYINSTIAWSTELRGLVGIPDRAATGDLGTGLQVTF